MKKIRIDKFLANMGQGSRREIHILIRKGAVKVNGETIKAFDVPVDTDNDVVLLNNVKIAYQKYIYLMMNKPQGYVSANEDKYDPTVMELLPEPYSNMELFVAGRLDKDTEGLLILTNNGKFAHNMLSPKKHVPKTYFAIIDSSVNDDDVTKFKEGITIDDGYVCKSGDLVVLKNGDNAHIHLTISEGKFHQVKRMFEAVGKNVTFLKRVRIGKLDLIDGLELGCITPLDSNQLELIGADLGE